MPTGVSHKIPLLFQQCHLLTNGGIHKITERRTCINRRKVRTRLRSVIIAKYSFVICDFVTEKSKEKE